jgi:hypothetical protein
MTLLKPASQMGRNETVDNVPDASREPGPEPTGEAEHRQLMVMFCDLTENSLLLRQQDSHRL